ncbi:MAG TPA: DUF4193 family protein [Acidimicrobiia bacterium]|nr:DUF4193 family protein [Acidimicrobiia bacterium]
MSDDDFEDTELEIEDEAELGEEDIDADDLEDLDAEDLDADDLDILGDEDEQEAGDLDPEVPVAVVTDETATETSEEEDDDVLDLDEELHPDDVEEPLDVLLRDRTASATLEDDEEELEDEEIDVDERGDGSTTRIVPRRADEFLCQSCFLVLPLRRLADKDRQFCDDCA